ncbi:hypothetical protein [Solidesulfovibrio sp. C21]|uniref:hypothetical protein n=1 Tax=Solidesulfovibrio sp. C21 TaxID=3398613 RepID=UPI0039FDD4B4
MHGGGVLNSKHEKLLCFFVVACFCVMFAIFLNYCIIFIISVPLDYDAGYNASIAKNIANGLGYVSSYHNLIMFNRQVTTGPVMIFPLAFAIRILGNLYYLPGLFALCLNMFLLSMIIIVRYKMIGWKANGVDTILDIFFFVLFILFSALPNYWCVFLGETPATLCLILGLLLYYLDTDKKAILFLSGLALGLAVMIKMIVILPLVVFIGFECLTGLRTTRGSRDVLASIRAFIKKNDPFFVALVAPCIFFEIYKIWALKSFVKYSILKKYELFFFLNKSGTSDFSFIKLVGNIKDQLLLLSSNSLSLIFVFFLLGSFTFAIFNFRRYCDKNRLASSMLTMSFAFLVWWVIGDKKYIWIRHYYVGQVLLIVGLYLFINTLEIRHKFLIATLFLLMTLSLTRYSLLGFIQSAQTYAKIQETYDAVHFVDTHRDYTFIATGWWVPREIEYLSDRYLVFKDAIPMLSGLPYGNYYLVRNKKVWNWDKDRLFYKIASLCDKKIVFENDLYIISQCDHIGRRGQ